MHFKRLAVFLVVFLVSAPSFSANHDSAAFRQSIQSIIADNTDVDGLIRLKGQKLYGTTTIKQIFALNNYNPLWNQQAVNELLMEINASELDGLAKRDYFPENLSFRNKQNLLNNLDATSRATRELLLTESFLRLAYHLRFGKVDPLSLDSNWNYQKRLDMKDPVPAIHQAIKNRRIKALLDSERPAHKYYKKLKNVLATYLEIKKNGGWPVIPSGKVIKPGNVSKRIPLIRLRLLKTGDYAQHDEHRNLSMFYDADLEHAAKVFQSKHGLHVDGVIGKQTLAAMNVPASDRVNQIRVNMERLRWYMHEIKNDFLLVDIAGFEAFLVQGGEKVWRENVVVGKAFTATPVFKGNLQYLEFNPTWTIPPSIIKDKILPNLKKNPDYLSDKGYLLLDLDGHRLNPLTINWHKQRGFPYIVRQPAGKNNVLGLVKFIFPNPHFVFLHDTNHRTLFNRTVRTFSHGCIRVDNPLKLAELLLAANPGWQGTDKMQKIIASGKTERVHPKKKIPVLITYTTAGVDESGNAIFKTDIYNRDPAVLKGLEGPIKVAADVRKKVEEFDLARQPDKI